MNAIQTRAKELNYNLKKTEVSKALVIEQLAKEFKRPESEILHEMKQPIVKPKKAEKVDDRPISSGNLSHTETERTAINGNVFIITSAQNNTDVHTSFLKNLVAYAEHRDAELLIFPFLYNKNGFQNGEGQDHVYYDKLVKPFLQDESVWLSENRKVAAMAFNILPTVKAPLAGMREAIGGAEAMIVPHATIAHECVPVLGAQFGRVVPSMYSTGTVTMRNYIQQQAGHKAENRHNFGALIVEFNEHGAFWIRQIETDESGKFYDMDVMVHKGKITAGQTVDVLNYGDIHAEKIDTPVADKQWGYSNSLLDFLKPKFQMAHDLLDFEALNHHNRGNHYHMANNQMKRLTVAGDLQKVTGILLDMARPFCKTVVVRSNHDDALDRWLADPMYEPRKDPANALTYYKLQVAAYKHLQNDTFFDSLPKAIQICTGEAVESVTFLRASQSFIVNGVELGEHGHSGTNGSRGSPKQFAGQKCTTGHTHSPSIYNGCYTAGVSGKLAMGYNETGASSWQQACVVQYLSGFRTIVHVKQNGAGELDYMAR